MNINITQQEHLNNIVKQVEAEKIIYLDFDGIFGGLMLYNTTEKFAKSVQYSARYAIEMLRYYGFEVNVITGDASGTGNLITNAILDRVPVNNIYAVSGKDKYKFIKERHDISKVFYAGDDMYDIAMKDMILLTTSNAFAGLRNVASYVSLSSSHDYFVLELANAILAAFDIDVELYSNKTKYDLTVSATTSNIANKLPIYVLTENSTKFSTTYNTILTTYYNVNVSDLHTAIYNASLDGINILSDNTAKRTYIVTNIFEFASYCDKFAQPAGEIYLIYDADNAINSQSLLSALTIINDAKLSNLQICTKHLLLEERINLYNLLVSNSLYNVLTALDAFYTTLFNNTDTPSIPLPTVQLGLQQNNDIIVRAGDTIDDIIFNMNTSTGVLNLTNCNITMSILDSTDTIIRTLSIGNGLSFVNAAQGSFKIDSQIFNVQDATYIYAIKFAFASGLIKTYINANFIVLKNLVHV
jgi:3-deoxy-D-manno-octulosonate 8-phosphate phosphatase KdsC-like HAD superfamily phosphatase